MSGARISSSSSASLCSSSPLPDNPLALAKLFESSTWYCLAVAWWSACSDKVINWEMNEKRRDSWGNHWHQRCFLGSENVAADEDHLETFALHLSSSSSFFFPRDNELDSAPLGFSQSIWKRQLNWKWRRILFLFFFIHFYSLHLALRKYCLEFGANAFACRQFWAG